MRRNRFIIFYLSVALLSTPGLGAGVSLYDRSYALVIGISDYAAWTDLRYARKDAEAMTGYLENRGFEVSALYDAEATREKIVSTANDLARDVGDDDRVLVFFAGHGQTESFGGRDWGYLVPHDGTSDSASYISMKQLVELSERMHRAKHQLFILDSCFGGLIGTVRGTLSRNPDRRDYLEENAKRIARDYLTAGGKNQIVLDGGPVGQSYFMGYLLKALRAGAADANGDDYVTSSELASYMVPAAANDYQTPASGVLPGDEGGDFVFSLNVRSTKVSRPVDLVAGAAFTITKPSENGIEVSRTMFVDGTAELPAGYCIWVFVRREDFANDWWPQGEARVLPSSNRWRVAVNFGGPQDVGWIFDIAAVVVDEKEDLRLRRYMSDGRRTGDYKPIALPRTAIEPQRRYVLKVDHGDDGGPPGRKLADQEILRKLKDADAYLAGGPTGRMEALKFFREVLAALSPDARRKLDAEILRQAEKEYGDGFRESAARKYRYLFKELLDSGLQANDDQ